MTAEEFYFVYDKVVLYDKYKEFKNTQSCYSVSEVRFSKFAIS